MSEARWTKGDWSVLPGIRCGYGVDACDGNAVREVACFQDGECRYGSIHEEADANLIAASPDMAEALQRLLDSYIAVTDGDPDIDPDVIRARAALAKARGES